MNEQTFTISVYTENNPGLLNRIATIFVKRHINIESLNVSASEIEAVSRFTIVVNTTEKQADKLVGQIQKQVEVIKAYYHLDNEIIYHETALYKLSSNLLFENRTIQNVIKDSQVNVITINADFFVIEKTGRRGDTEALYKALKSYGIMQFVRSGRVAVSKERLYVSDVLKDFS